MSKTGKQPKLGDNGLLTVKGVNNDGSVTGDLKIKGSLFSSATIKEERIKPIAQYLKDHTYSVKVNENNTISNSIVCTLNDKTVGCKGTFTIDRLIDNDDYVIGHLKTESNEYNYAKLYLGQNDAAARRVGNNIQVIVNDCQEGVIFCIDNNNHPVVEKTNSPHNSSISMPQPPGKKKNSVTKQYLHLVGKKGTVLINKFSKGHNAIGILTVEGKQYKDINALVSSFKGMQDRAKLIGTSCNVIVNTIQGNEWIYCLLESTDNVQTAAQDISLSQSNSQKEAIYSDSGDNAFQNALVVQYYIVNNRPELINKLQFKREADNCSIYLEDSTGLSVEEIKHYISDHSDLIQALQQQLFNYLHNYH